MEKDKKIRGKEKFVETTGAFCVRFRMALEIIFLLILQIHCLVKIIA